MANRPDLRTKAGKLWLELQKGTPKKKAALIVGVNPKNVAQVMRTQNFQALERSSYKEEILKHITLAQVAAEHVKVMTQDEDLAAKNTAIKMALEKIEPDNEPQSEPEKILVILR